MKKICENHHTKFSVRRRWGDEAKWHCSHLPCTWWGRWSERNHDYTKSMAGKRQAHVLNRLGMVFLSASTIIELWKHHPYSSPYVCMCLAESLRVRVYCKCRCFEGVICSTNFDILKWLPAGIAHFVGGIRRYMNVNSALGYVVDWVRLSSVLVFGCVSTLTRLDLELLAPCVISKLKFQHWHIMGYIQGIKFGDAGKAQTYTTTGYKHWVKLVYFIDEGFADVNCRRRKFLTLWLCRTVRSPWRFIWGVWKR